MKKVLKYIAIMIMILMGAFIYQYRETKQMVNIVVNHELNASFYIRQFHKIQHAKNLVQLQQATEQTLSAFQQAQQALNAVSLYSPQAIDVRKEYEKGVMSLQEQLYKIKQSNNENDLAMLKKELAKSEQILLNAREKLFNLAQQYHLEIQLKIG